MPFRSLRILAIAGLSIGASIAWADPSAAADTCSPRTLKGEYIYALSGFKTAGDSAAQRTPFAQAGNEQFKGDGTMAGAGTMSSNGVIAKVTYKGTYTLNADCSGTVTFTDNQGQVAHYDIFADNDGDSFTYLQTDAGIVSAGWERRH